MKISFIIPCYNAGKYIERCIRSITNQNLKDYEIIAINDGSTDNTQEILNNLSDNNLKVVNKGNEGVSVTRNKGIDIAQGDTIMFVDADDYILDGSLTYLNNINIDSLPDLTIYGLIRKAKDGIQRIYERDERLYQNAEILEFIKVTDALPIGSPCAKLFKMSILIDNSIRFKPGQKLFEDACFVFDYLKHCNSVEMSARDVYFYDTGGSVSSGFYGDVFFRDFAEYVKGQQSLVAHFSSYLPPEQSGKAEESVLNEINKRNSFLHIAEIYKLYRRDTTHYQNKVYWLKKILENADITTPGWHKNMYTYPPLLITKWRNHPSLLHFALSLIFCAERILRK